MFDISTASSSPKLTKLKVFYQWKSDLWRVTFHTLKNGDVIAGVKTLKGTINSSACRPSLVICLLDGLIRFWWFVEKNFMCVAASDRRVRSHIHTYINPKNYTLLRSRVQKHRMRMYRIQINKLTKEKSQARIFVFPRKSWVFLY